MSPALVEANGLVKEYGAFRAVDGLDLTLAEGEVYGFLGPNGSGKSTTILMLLGLTEPTAGRVSVVGHDPTRDPLAVKRQVGYLPESVGFYPDLSGRANLRYTAALNRIPREEAERRIEALLDTVELAGAAAQPVGQYSRGMRQRLGLADVLLKQPRIIILDDPTLGLDPAGIQWLLGIIEELSSQQGIAVFLSSHQLHEVQRVCHRVGIMSHGKMVLEGTLEELTQRSGGHGYIFALEVSSASDALLAQLQALPGVTGCRSSGAEVLLEGTEDVRAQAAAVVVGTGSALLGMRTVDRSLEEIYLRYFQED